MVDAEAIAAGFSAGLIFELCLRVRRFFDFAYAPVYFTFLPFQVLNRDLSMYVGAEFAGYGEALSEDERKNLETRIQLRGALAAAVSAIVIPGVAALAAAFYMPRKALLPALLMVLLLQGWRVLLGARDFWLHAEDASARVRRHLGLVYAAYLAVTLWVFGRTYLAAHPFIVAGDYLGLALEGISILVKDVLIWSILLALLAGHFLNRLTAAQRLPVVVPQAVNDGANAVTPILEAASFGLIPGASLADTVSDAFPRAADFMTEDVRGVVFNLSGSIIFPTGQPQLLPIGREHLMELVAVISTCEAKTVLIHCHTDSRGSRPNNLLLSQRRAEAVRSLFVEAGIPAERVEARGFGPDFPIATNDTAEGRASNRRLEIVVPR